MATAIMIFLFVYSIVITLMYFKKIRNNGVRLTIQNDNS